MTVAVTYPEQGATRGPLPPGYTHVDRREPLGSGPAVFDRAVHALVDWRMHRGAGLGVAADGPAVPGTVVRLRIGWRRLGLTAPCRVVYVVDEPHRRGFAYGTLPGHPERGEETFVVEAAPDGRVHLHIRAFSRPATRLARLGGPVNRRAQRLVTDHYFAALRRLAGG